MKLRIDTIFEKLASGIFNGHYSKFFSLCLSGHSLCEFYDSDCVPKFRHVRLNFNLFRMMEKYKFESIFKKYAFLSDKDVSKLLEKWNFELEINSFNYDKAADDVDIPKLLKHLFEDEVWAKNLSNIANILKKFERL